MRYQMMPDTACTFIHRRVIGAISGGLTGGIGGAIGGFVGGGGRPGRGPSAIDIEIQRQRDAGTRPAQLRDARRRARQERNATRRLPATTAVNLGAPPPSVPQNCSPPLTRDVDGQCRFAGSPADVSVGGGMGGAAVMGRFGAALAPDTEMRLHRECLPGMVLGNDDLCYNKRDITNRERKYPKGRAPLLTGGERNAITKASRAAKKIERTAKQLQKMGMLKKPSRGRAPSSIRHLTGPQHSN